MKLIRTFEITSDEFYDYTEDRIIEEASKATNRKVRKKELCTGMHYRNQSTGVDVKIDCYERGKCYRATATTKTDFMTVSYETEETDKGLQITFEQILSDDSRKKNKVSNAFSQLISFGRMSNTLYDIRNEILAIRNDVPLPKQQKPEQYKALKKYIQKKTEEQK